MTIMVIRIIAGDTLNHFMTIITEVMTGITTLISIQVAWLQPRRWLALVHRDTLPDRIRWVLV